MMRQFFTVLAVALNLYSCGAPAFAGAFNPGDTAAPSVLCPTEEVIYQIAGYFEKGDPDSAVDLARGQCAFQSPMAAPWRVKLVQELDAVQVPDSGDIAIWKVTFENFPRPLYTILMKDGGPHRELTT